MQVLVWQVWHAQPEVWIRPTLRKFVWPACVPSVYPEPFWGLHRPPTFYVCPIKGDRAGAPNSALIITSSWLRRFLRPSKSGFRRWCKVERNNGKKHPLGLGKSTKGTARPSHEQSWSKKCISALFTTIGPCTFEVQAQHIATGY